MLSVRLEGSTTDEALREVEANVAVLISEEMVAQHELGAHPDPVPDCPTCRAHAATRHRALPFGA